METILAEAYPFWSKLTVEEKNQILAGCTRAVYEKGRQIHRSDLGCKGAILLLSGLLRVYIVSDEGGRSHCSAFMRERAASFLRPACWIPSNLIF